MLQLATTASATTTAVVSNLLTSIKCLLFSCEIQDTFTYFKLNKLWGRSGWIAQKYCKAITSPEGSQLDITFTTSTATFTVTGDATDNIYSLLLRQTLSLLIYSKYNCCCFCWCNCHYYLALSVDLAATTTSPKSTADIQYVDFFPLFCSLCPASVLHLDVCVCAIISSSATREWRSETDVVADNQLTFRLPLVF